MQDKESPKATADDAEVCPNCNGREFLRELKEQKFLYGKDGDASELRASVPVYECKACGFQFTGEDAEEARHDAICRHLRLMTPKEIRGIREKWEMTRAELAAVSRLGTASLARWEAGILIQNGANDQLLYLLQFQENIALLNRRELQFAGANNDTADSADEVPERVASDLVHNRRIERRQRRCPFRGRPRMIDRPEECRAAAAGWRP